MTEPTLVGITNTSTSTLSEPAGTIPGDWLVAIIQSFSTPGALAGWTTPLRGSQGSINYIQRGSSPPSYSSSNVGAACVYSLRPNTVPFSQFSFVDSGSESGTTINGPADPLVNNTSFCVECVLGDGGSWNVTAVPTLITRDDTTHSFGPGFSGHAFSSGGLPPYSPITFGGAQSGAHVYMLSMIMQAPIKGGSNLPLLGVG